MISLVFNAVVFPIGLYFLVILESCGGWVSVPLTFMLMLSRNKCCHADSRVRHVAVNYVVVLLKDVEE